MKRCLMMVELHRPVMEKEVIQHLVRRSDGIFVDATVGDGGHAEAICKKLEPPGMLIGLDWDEEALKRAENRLEAYKGRIKLLHHSYADLEQILLSLEIDGVDGILIDLGASTLQLMDPERGFSYQHEGDLDMRMDRRSSLTAKDVINQYSEEQLAAIFFSYGEERWSKKIAALIVREREKSGPITESKKLADIVREAIPARFRRHGGHPSRKIFQALRLEVNRELDNISVVLPQVIKALIPGGRICIIAYHSLEDRLIKRFFRQETGRCDCPPNKPCVCDRKARLNILTGKALKPSPSEIDDNPRARSARMRVAEKL
jgi:16S rRNA (cytosine1402-N4)-methyltransferase